MTRINDIMAYTKNMNKLSKIIMNAELNENTNEYNDYFSLFEKVDNYLNEAIKELFLHEDELLAFLSLISSHNSENNNLENIDNDNLKLIDADFEKQFGDFIAGLEYNQDKYENEFNDDEDDENIISENIEEEEVFQDAILEDIDYIRCCMDEKTQLIITAVLNRIYLEFLSKMHYIDIQIRNDDYSNKDEVKDDYIYCLLNIQIHKLSALYLYKKIRELLNNNNLSKKNKEYLLGAKYKLLVIESDLIYYEKYSLKRIDEIIKNEKQKYDSYLKYANYYQSINAFSGCINIVKRYINDVLESLQQVDDEEYKNNRLKFDLLCSYISNYYDLVLIDIVVDDEDVLRDFKTTQSDAYYKNERIKTKVLTAINESIGEK